MRCCNLPRSGGRYTCNAPTGREHVAGYGNFTSASTVFTPDDSTSSSSA